jgi:hypothetical protein
MCPDTAAAGVSLSAYRLPPYVCSDTDCYIYILILLYMCPDTAAAGVGLSAHRLPPYVCSDTDCYIRVLCPMCPDTAGAGVGLSAHRLPRVVLAPTALLPCSRFSLYLLYSQLSFPAAGAGSDSSPSLQQVPTLLASLALPQYKRHAVHSHRRLAVPAAGTPRFLALLVSKYEY